MSDAVNHPQHYNDHPSGVECITIVEHMGFNVGNAVKYLWRAGLKDGLQIQDLRKAAWYVNREIERLTGGVTPAPDGVELIPLGEAARTPTGLNQQIADALRRALAGLVDPDPDEPDCPIPRPDDGVAEPVSGGGWEAVNGADHSMLTFIAPDAYPSSVGCQEMLGHKRCTRHALDEHGRAWHLAGCDCRYGSKTLPLHAQAVWPVRDDGSEL